jgi:class 3 adenylate cyclase
VFDFVNSYYEQVSPIIRTFKGFIVKYMGDGIMAVCLKDGVPETWTGDTVMITK